MKISIAAIVLYSVTLSACVSPAIYKDPKTGQVAQCNPSNVGFPIAAQHEVDECGAAYSRMGWVRQ